MNKIEIPTSEADERAVIGAAINHPDAALIAWMILSPEDFYLPIHRRLFECCLRLGDDRSWEGWERRMRAAARVQGSSRDLVDRLVDVAPTLTLIGPWATRVRKASVARATMAALADAFNALGEGEPVEATLARLRDLRAA